MPEHSFAQKTSLVKASPAAQEADFTGQLERDFKVAPDQVLARPYHLYKKSGGVGCTAWQWEKKGDQVQPSEVR